MSLVVVPWPGALCYEVFKWWTPLSAAASQIILLVIPSPLPCSLTLYSVFSLDWDQSSVLALLFHLFTFLPTFWPTALTLPFNFSILLIYLFAFYFITFLYLGKLCFSFPGAASSFLIIPFPTTSISCLVDTKLFLPFSTCSLDYFWAFPWPSALSPGSFFVWADFCLPCGWKFIWWSAGSSCPWC